MRHYVLDQYMKMTKKLIIICRKYPLFLHFPLWNSIRGLAWTGSSSFYSNIEADNVLCRRHPVTIHWISENGKYSTLKKKGKENLKTFSVEDFYCRYISDFMKNPKTSKDKETLFWWFTFHCFWKNVFDLILDDLLMTMMKKDASDHLTENKALCVRLHL